MSAHLAAAVAALVANRAKRKSLKSTCAMCRRTYLTDEMVQFGSNRTICRACNKTIGK